MASNTSLDLTSLDFEELKQNFVSYLRDQKQFADYDFEGSSLNVLLDLLAYNTHKNAFLTNMLFSESFLDSAQLRDSITSRAKELNYLPRSTRSAKARVRVTFKATGESQPYIIPKGSSFSTLVKNQSYVFSMPETITVASADTNFTFETDLYEGIYLKDSYIFPASLDGQRFKISNKNVDTDSLSVVVYEDNSLFGQRYLFSRTLLDLNESSKVFFLQPSENGFYEVRFGDNNLGRRPKINSTIVLDYRISNDIRANGAKSFAINFDPTGAISELTGSARTTTLSVAQNGAPQETIESVKYYAPRHFQIQERTIVPSDYEIALKTEFPEINAVAVYGGEDHTPQMFGRVFIAVDINDVDGFPQSKKDQYFEFIRRRSPLFPILIDPEFTYLKVKSLVRYNINVTTASRENIKTLIKSAINTFNQTELDDFNVTLRNSKFCEAIDSSDDSIVSNITDVQLYKKINPSLNLLQNLSVNFNIALKNDLPKQGDRYLISDQTTIRSSTFSVNGVACSFEDDNDGIIRLVRADGSYHIKITNVGTVDYDTGLITISSIKFDSYDGPHINIYVVPRDKDIVSPLRNIMTIEPETIELDVQQVRV